MPTYEYLCESCKHAWEEEQRIVEPPIELCPRCGQTSAKRQVSKSAFVLAGTGWARDRYARSVIKP